MLTYLGIFLGILLVEEEIYLSVGWQDNEVARWFRMHFLQSGVHTPEPGRTEAQRTKSESKSVCCRYLSSYHPQRYEYLSTFHTSAASFPSSDSLPQCQTTASSSHEERRLRRKKRTLSADEIPAGKRQGDESINRRA